MLLGMGQLMAQSPDQAMSGKIGLGLGYAFTGYREETDLPLNRYLNAFTLIVNGNIEKGSFFHSLNIGFFRGDNDAIKSFPLDNSWEEPLEPGNQYFTYYRTDYTFTRVFGEYALDYRLWGTGAFPGYLGGALRGDLYVMETLNNYLHTSVTAIVSLNLHASQKWIINDSHSLVFSMSVPVLGYAVRPNFTGYIMPLETGVISLHNYQAVFGDLKYYYRINTLLSFNSGLGFELSHVEFPRPRRDAVFRLSAGVAFSF